jgi:hypothetical protein
MVEKVLEAKETLHAEETPVTVTSGGPVEVGSVEVFFSVMVPTTPQVQVSASEEFTRETFEGALDKVSRPTGRGKFAHLPTSSDEFARRKQEEIDLEERR